MSSEEVAYLECMWQIHSRLLGNRRNKMCVVHNDHDYARVQMCNCVTYHISAARDQCWKRLVVQAAEITSMYF